MVAQRAERAGEIETARREARMDPLRLAADQTIRVSPTLPPVTLEQRLTT